MAADRASDPARAVIDGAIASVVERHVPPGVSRTADAIGYALAGGGKRVRGRLLLAAYRAAGGAGDASLLAAAVEIVHAYSLVHDDLPCMDDDDLRRGRPTVHRAFDVATATRAGIAMVPLAVLAAVEAAAALGLDVSRAAAITRALMRASGAGGMIGGQLMDLEGEGREHAVEGLERIHRAKTGALIAVAARLGGEAAGAPPARVEALDRFGAAIGLAFQIADDLLDVTATSEALGKTAGKDVATRKGTYPALLGIDGARERASALIEEGLGALAAEGLLTPELEGIARYTVSRGN
ncbi:MAG: polyprenyl synthetase family protein [Gemmatimonadaceae bacterium]